MILLRQTSIVGYYIIIVVFKIMRMLLFNTKLGMVTILQTVNSI